MRESTGRGLSPGTDVSFPHTAAPGEKRDGSRVGGRHAWSRCLLARLAADSRTRFYRGGFSGWSVTGTVLLLEAQRGPQGPGRCFSPSPPPSTRAHVSLLHIVCSARLSFFLLDARQSR